MKILTEPLSRKLKGTNISDYARIVRVADYYDNVLHGRENNGVSVMPHQAFEVVLAVSEAFLTRTLCRCFGIP